jgi:DNA-binding response OmpR family regulator
MANRDYTILVVDDDELNRDMLSRRLERKEYKVLVASDGSEALELAGRELIDMVILDIMMPGMSGLEVLKILRQTRSATELPVIMASAKGESQDVVNALELGANDYATKPLDFPVLLARIEAQLRLKVPFESEKAADPTGADMGTILLEPGAAKPDEDDAQKPDLVLDKARTASEAAGPVAGTILAEKYRLENEIGSGNFGTVYKATHLGLNLHVAVKVLQTSLGTTMEDLARFQREGMSACRVKHPNAVSVLDFGVTATGVSYLVMELLEGRSLADEIEESGKLSPHRCMDIIEPVCAALEEAHSVGLLHRDLKPANIFLHHERGKEIIKVVDFGTAKFRDDASANNLTLQGTVIGTPAYLAPERLANRPYDGRSDVYSLGVMLYQMLCGKVPFEATDGNPMTVAMMHMNDAAKSLAGEIPDVTEAVDKVVAMALEKDPGKRLLPGDLVERLREAVGPDLRQEKKNPTMDTMVLTDLPFGDKPQEGTEA